MTPSSNGLFGRTFSIAAFMLALFGCNVAKSAVPNVILHPTTITRQLQLGDHWTYEINLRIPNSDDPTAPVILKLFSVNASTNIHETLDIVVVKTPSGVNSNKDNQAASDGTFSYEDLSTSKPTDSLSLLVTLKYRDENRKDVAKYAVYRIHQLNDDGKLSLWQPNTAFQDPDQASQDTRDVLPGTWSIGTQWDAFFLCDPLTLSLNDIARSFNTSLNTVVGEDVITTKVGKFATWKVSRTKALGEATTDDVWWFDPQVGLPVQIQTDFESGTLLSIKLVEMNLAGTQVQHAKK